MGRACLLTGDLSGVHHLEEIAQAGLPVPAVNQIEVGYFPRCYLMSNFDPCLPFSAPPLLPATSDRGVLQVDGYRRPSLLAARAGQT